MRHYQSIPVCESKNILESITCDDCGRLYDATNIKELESFTHIDFVAGEDSPFGEGNHVVADICQQCMYRMINRFCQTGIERVSINSAGHVHSELEETTASEAN